MLQRCEVTVPDFNLITPPTNVVGPKINTRGVNVRKQKIVLPKKTQLDVVKDMSILVKGNQIDSGEEYQTVQMQITRKDLMCKFNALTMDPDFMCNVKKFSGKTRIQHNSSWAMPCDIANQEMVPLSFIFPKQDDRQEVLFVYVDKNTMSVLNKHLDR